MDIKPGHKITDPCPYCKAKAQQTTYTVDYIKKSSYFVCDICGKQWTNKLTFWQKLKQLTHST